jgi:hypothetical protein
MKKMPWNKTRAFFIFGVRHDNIGKGIIINQMSNKVDKYLSTVFTKKEGY